MAAALGTSSLRQKHLRLPLLPPSSTLNPRWVDSTRPPFPPSHPLVPSPPSTVRVDSASPPRLCKKATGYQDGGGGECQPVSSAQTPNPKSGGYRAELQKK